jgi:hypothetical protein
VRCERRPDKTRTAVRVNEACFECNKFFRITGWDTAEGRTDNLKISQGVWIFSLKFQVLTQHNYSLQIFKDFVAKEMQDGPMDAKK